MKGYCTALSDATRSPPEEEPVAMTLECSPVPTSGHRMELVNAAGGFCPWCVGSCRGGRAVAQQPHSNSLGQSGGVRGCGSWGAAPHDQDQHGGRPEYVHGSCLDPIDPQ